MMRPQHADLTRVRARAVGVLTVALLVVVVFSFAWYLLVPRFDVVEVEAQIAQRQDALQAQMQSATSSHWSSASSQA